MTEPRTDSDSARVLTRETIALVQNYVRPILCGDPPSFSSEPFIRGGTVTFVKTNARCFGITNWHVINGFREIREKRDPLHCQLDTLFFDFESRLIDENKRLDLATLDITESEINKLSAIPFSPSKWPPDAPTIGEQAVIVGYPGQSRSMDSPEQICTPHIGFCLSVSSVSDTHVTFLIERDYLISDIGSVDPMKLQDYGGMSGSGVFVMRLAPTLVAIRSDFFHDFSLGIDFLKGPRIDWIYEDGKIHEPIS
jgi:hypothetical protein